MIPKLTGHKVYLICGVSGSGKTWVSKQLAGKFSYVPHDEHYKSIYTAVASAAYASPKPVITECPFAERIQRENLEKMGFQVIPVFVIEAPDLIAMRYHSREGQPIQKAAYTRASTIINRAREWGAFYGTSKEVLAHLMELQ